jgi:hypothetical protein
MKRPAAFAVILVIAVSLATAALLLPGCGGGGSTGQAKSLAIKANDAAGQMNTEVSKLTQEFKTLDSETPEGSVPDKSKWAAAATGIKAKTDAALKKTEEIIKTYEEMLDLKGVPKYSEFAKLQLQILRLTEQSIKAIVTYVDKINAMLASGTLTPDAYKQARTAFYNEETALGQQAQSLSEEASKLRKDNNLFQ